MTDPPTTERIGASPPSHQFTESKVEYVKRPVIQFRPGSLGLTPPQAHALHLFSRPRPMRSAAEAMRCDASCITHIADDLESLGLAERSIDPSDRRVKQMTLTVEGRELHERLQELLYDANPLARNLDEDEQRSLTGLLGDLPSTRDED